LRAAGWQRHFVGEEVLGVQATAANVGAGAFTCYVRRAQPDKLCYSYGRGFWVACWQSATEHFAFFGGLVAKGAGFVDLGGQFLDPGDDAVLFS